MSSATSLDLPTAGRTEDREEVARALVARAVERLAEKGLLARPADHGRVQRARDRLRAVSDLDESPRAQRLCLTLRGERADELGRDCTRQQAVGRIANEDHAGLGGLLEPGRHVDGVARDERVARAGDDLACVDSDPGPEAEGGDRIAQLDGRAGGAQASSSWICGIPNTAMTASPMNFSTVAPCRSNAARASSK